MSDKAKINKLEEHEVLEKSLKIEGADELFEEALHSMEERKKEDKKIQSQADEDVFEVDADDALLNQEEVLSMSQAQKIVTEQSQEESDATSKSSDVTTTQEIKFVSTPDDGALDELKEALALEKNAREKLENEKKELYEKFVRLNADFDNFRKRTIRDKEDLRRFANEKILKDLLTPLDNFERALESSDGKELSLATFREGIEMVYRQFLDMLKRYDVERFESLHKPFDYQYHEAISTIPTNEIPPETVYAEFQAGYTVHDRLLRAARVVVAKALPVEPKEVEPKEVEQPSEESDTTSSQESNSTESSSNLDADSEIKE